MQEAVSWLHFLSRPKRGKPPRGTWFCFRFEQGQSLPTSLKRKIFASLLTAAIEARHGDILVYFEQLQVGQLYPAIHFAGGKRLNRLFSAGFSPRFFL